MRRTPGDNRIDIATCGSTAKPCRISALSARLPGVSAGAVKVSP